jgi:hypothetical protein
MKKITLEIYVSDDFKVNTSELLELFGKKYNSNFWSIDSLKEVEMRWFDSLDDFSSIGKVKEYIDSK